MGGEDGPDGQVAAAIDEVAKAFELALDAIGRIDDPVLAFHRTSELWACLRHSTDANGRVRQRLAAQARRAHPTLDLTTLADLLSTEAHRIGKARAGQLVADGTRQLPPSDTT